MIRNLAVDTSRFSLVATGHVNPVHAWIPDPQNPGRNIMSTDQTRDDISGLPLWTVDALAMDEERAETLGVQVEAAHQPVVKAFESINFIGLNVRVGVDKRTNQVRMYWSASGISDKPGTKTSPSPFDSAKAS